MKYVISQQSVSQYQVEAKTKEEAIAFLENNQVDPIWTEFGTTEVTDKICSSIDEKKARLIEFETQWLLDSGEFSEIEFIMKHGFKGFDNYTDEEIEKDYKETFED
jgi:hypothetical protein